MIAVDVILNPKQASKNVDFFPGAQTILQEMT